jgi:hypothetical protein
MVADGADTIYDPEHWVVASYIDPRGYIGAVSNAGRVLIKAGGQIGDVATADALGAPRLAPRPPWRNAVTRRNRFHG